MNNGRDCAHGRQVGKCDTCDLIEAEQRIMELEAGQDRVDYFKNEILMLSSQVVDLLDERDQLKALLQAERDNSLFMAKRIEQLEKSNLELAVDLGTKRIEVKEYELWIAGIADYCGALPAWLRQSAKNMLAKGAK